MRLKYFLLFVTFFIISVFSPYYTMAAETEQLETSKISIEMYDEYKKIYSMERHTDKELQNDCIYCFDVSNDGMVAIGTKKDGKGFIYVFDSGFNYLCTYCFNLFGSFNLEWTNSKIRVFYIRDDTAVTYNEDGSIFNVETLSDSMENNNYLRSLRKTTRQCGEYEYKIKNDMGILNVFVGNSSYTQLIKTDKAGNVSVLYDVNTKQTHKVLVLVIFFTVFLLLVVSVIIKSRRECTVDGFLSQDENP